MGGPTFNGIGIMLELGKRNEADPKNFSLAVVKYE
jgi:hypothetical protein